MNVQILLLLVVIAVGAVVIKESNKAPQETGEINTSVAPTVADITPSPDNASPIPSKSTKEVSPTKFPTLDSTTELSASWQYPESSYVADSKWQSSDSAEKITDWYVAKIKSMGVPVTSFVKTNANDKILNSLAAAKNDWKIKVEVTQESKNTPVTITVVLDN